MREIQETLACLRNEPLSDMWRYAGRQKFEFGVQRPFRNRKGVVTTRADRGLVVSCDWRLWAYEELILSASDFGPGTARRDGDGEGFYDELGVFPPLVEQIEVLEQGGIRLVLSRGYILEIIPNGGGEYREGFLEGEQWRFMPKEEAADQVVLTDAGMEYVEADEFTALVATSMASRKPATV